MEKKKPQGLWNSLLDALRAGDQPEAKAGPTPVPGSQEDPKSTYWKPLYDKQGNYIGPRD